MEIPRSTSNVRVEVVGGAGSKATRVCCAKRGDRLPNDNDAVCSCHFLDASSSFSPTVFKRNPMYAHIFRSPEGSKKKPANSRKKLLLPGEPDLLLSSPKKGPIMQGTFSVADSCSDDVLAIPMDTTTGLEPLIDDLNSDNVLIIPLDGNVNCIQTADTTVTTPETPLTAKSSEIVTPEGSANVESTPSISDMKERFLRKMAEGRRLFRSQWEEKKQIKKSLSTLQTHNRLLVKELEEKNNSLSVAISEKKNCETEINRLKTVVASLQEKIINKTTALKKCEETVLQLQLQSKEDQEMLQKVNTKLASVEEALQKSNTAKCTVLRAQRELSEQLTAEKFRLHIENISTLDCKVSHYTGLPNYGTFKWLFSLFNNFTLSYYNFNVESISRENQLFMTLIRLKLGFGLQTLADWFRCSKTTVSNIVLTWVSALHTVLFDGFMGVIPSLAKVQQSLPECFKPFPTCRIVLDCTEVVTAVPKNMRKHNLTYSQYKHRTTFKGLVGVAPNGSCVFASKLYPGSTSDKAVVEDSKVAQVLQPGESVMADKGFLIGDLLPAGVSLIRPPFKTTVQFTEQQVIDSRKISKARVHVERAIERIKRYKILNFIPTCLAPRATMVFQVCCALTNLQKPLIAEVAGVLMEGANSSDEEDLE
ncbi:Putative nuclease [Frankliniella fusca]|uniref:Nuclease n=1 Tax=Frankliniella fusca TaxID=407009 RepID=A0AAE1HLF2_9NEOP|nr:Putative nuclease [Frankliniella fusca]